MTMLDRMRRHKNWLKWSLALVVLTFVVFYIPDFLRSTGAGAAPGEVVADIDGRPVTVAEFRRVYANQLQAYRSAYGGSLNQQLLRQLGIDRQILQQLIDERAALAEADRLGISASNAEVRERILRVPAFLENGQFIGEDRYRQMLTLNNPPVSVSEFEESIRRSIVLDKLRTALADWIAIPDAEVDAEFRRRNEKVKLELVVVPSDKFREGTTASDAEISTYFDAHKDEFRIGEKRRIRFVAAEAQKLRERVTVLPQDVERTYNQNIEQYSTPEQVRASHVLLKTEGKDEAEVRKRAEQILAEAKAGADFAELARKHSEDEGSKANGGDLDYFSRGRMVPEFDQAAFALEPGAISDLVKTQFGFHVIKVTGKKPASMRQLDEVREQIGDQVKWERAQTMLQDLASRLEGEITTPADMDKAAAANGLTVQESGFFLRDEPIAGIGPSPEVSAQAFALKEGEISGPLRTAQGVAFITVTGRQEPRVPKLDEVRDRVSDAVIRRKALDAARAKAESLREAASGGTGLAAAAKKAGLEVKTSEPLPRGAAWPEVGASDVVDSAAFALPAGALSDVVSTGNAAAVLRVVERTDVTPQEIAAGRAALRKELLDERRGRFFSAYMTKAKQRMKITIDRETLSRLIA